MEPTERSGHGSETRELDEFQRFASGTLNANALDVSANNNDRLLFRDSLRSAVAHTSLRHPLRDADGEYLTVRAGYIDKMVPNARADYVEGSHYISLNTAMFVAIQEFAMFCFTQREFFPSVGDPTLEESPKPIDDRVPGLWLLDHTKHGGKVEERHSKTITPRTETRYNASVYLGLLMARFVWLHEFQHCFQGHVRFVQYTKRASHMSEIEDPMELIGFSKREKPVVRDEVRRGLELEADKHAFWTCCRIQTDGKENIDGIAPLDLALRMRLTLFASYAVTWLFEEFQNYLDAKSGITHPSLYARLQNLIRTTRENIEPLHPDIPEAAQFAYNQFDILQRSIPSLYRTKDVYQGAYDPTVKSELEKIAQHFEPQLAALDRFRYREAKSTE